MFRDEKPSSGVYEPTCDGDEPQTNTHASAVDVQSSDAPVRYPVMMKDDTGRML